MRRLWPTFPAYAAIYILWGATYLAVRTVVLVTPPFAAAGLRFTVSGLLLLAICCRKPACRPTRVEWVNSTRLGLVMFTANYACFFWAEQRLYSGVAAVVVATMPVWIMLADWLIGGARRLSRASLAGCALGIAGVVMVTGGGAVAGRSQNNAAICVLLAGTLCWSFGSVWSRALKLPESQPVRSALQMTTGGAGLFVLALVAGEARAFTRALTEWTWVTWGCFAYLIVASIVAFTAYTWLLAHEPAARVASYAYVNPIVAIALGMGLAHERISVRQALGGGLVLLGVFATLRSRASLPGPQKLDAVSAGHALPENRR